jgi:anti-sigma factor RsiW
MPCDELEPLILRRLDGRLTVEAAQRFERHLERCDECREAFDTQKRVAAILSARPEIETSLGFTRRVMANLETELGCLDLLNWRAWTFRLAPVAAALIMVAALEFESIEATEPLEFSDLVTDWVVAQDGEVSPLVSLLWQEDVATETLLEVVLTAGPVEPF